MGLALLAVMIYFVFQAGQGSTEIAVAKDHDKARELFAEQAAQGDWHSAFSLGLMCLESNDAECAEERL